MPRVFMVLAGATLVVFAWLFYQYTAQQQEEAELIEYETVLNEKTAEIFEQAQDWSKPIQLDIEEDRLDGDYAVMAEYVLGQMRDRAEERNQYLRDLKAANWEHFLDIDRLEKDQAQGYKETETMLKQVHQIVQNYEQTIQRREESQIEQVKRLDIKQRYRQQLAQNLKSTQQESDAYAIFAIEKQSLAKADQLFALLKKYKWEKRNRMFMFHDEKAVQPFIALYKDIENLNKQMQQIKTKNQKIVEEAL
ncbi:hypothetical protein F965_01045 [Acinetobacter schindleri NIPH 900]|uniref:Uncharacterized protein n=1 Tax=Acinetobacter schindleri NIPH 900 TaxID=1217675 RepID=N8WPQ0_9GAMM|nr:hypothetical protein [Acinetobacter schindleri]ENV13941.1 hypothetical protein F965_01045 [Acinetobacter schindleri NIPH 900]